MKKKMMKGGSLSGTYLCDTGERQFVRKQVSLTENREYGFQRWNSQLKRLQRYNYMFQLYYPKVINYGKYNDEAYFDMEYFPNAITAHEFILTTLDFKKLDRFIDQLIYMMSRIHEAQLPSPENAMDLYIHEEIEEKLYACRHSDRFCNFMQYEDLYFNGSKCTSFVKVLDEYKGMMKLVYKNPTETFTHGNLTLENILFQPETERVIFIDPYEENIIDSHLADYSQIYQSSHALYETYDMNFPVIYGNTANCLVPRSPGMDYFSLKFSQFINEVCTQEEQIVIKLLEVSQFMRMLPFKMEINEDKMLFFYTLGSHLFQQIRDSR